MICKGRITRIEREDIKSCSVKQGIKKSDQRRYEESNKYAGSNGTYFSNFETIPQINMYLTIYATENTEEHRVKIDIRDSILEKNNLQRISSKKLKEIQDANVGQKVSFEVTDHGTIIFGDALKL